MIWETSNQNGGFSEGRPWLPVSAEHLAHSVSAQEEDRGTILHHYRRAIALRKAYPTLAKGRDDGVQSDGDIVYFTRVHGDQKIYCAFNLSDQSADHQLPAGSWRSIGDGIGGANPASNGSLQLAPWQCCLVVKQD